MVGALVVEEGEGNSQLRNRLANVFEYFQYMRLVLVNLPLFVPLITADGPASQSQNSERGGHPVEKPGAEKLED